MDHRVGVGLDQNLCQGLWVGHVKGFKNTGQKRKIGCIRLCFKMAIKIFHRPFGRWEGCQKGGAGG